VDLHEAAGETVQAGMEPAAAKLTRMTCQVAVDGTCGTGKAGGG
jgi:hypothetical protein